MGWDGMDGMGDQMGPSIFFILFRYIDHVYTYIHIHSKVVNNIVMGLKILGQVGGLGQKFQNHNLSVIFFSKFRLPIWKTKKSADSRVRFL